MTIPAGDVVWMTDATLHESLPLQAGGVRQYFRLVTSTCWLSPFWSPRTNAWDVVRGMTLLDSEKVERSLRRAMRALDADYESMGPVCCFGEVECRHVRAVIDLVLLSDILRHRMVLNFREPRPYPFASEYG